MVTYAAESECLCMCNILCKYSVNNKGTYRGLNAIVAQPKHCPFRVNTTIEFTNIRNATDNTGIWWSMFQLMSVPV